MTSLDLKTFLDSSETRAIFTRVIADRLAYYKYMRRCPNCDHLTYDNVSECFFCHVLSPVSKDLSWKRKPE